MKILSVCSARPNFIKLAAVDHAIRIYAPEWAHIIVHTGQHYDPLLSDVFFEQLHIPHPAVNLNVRGTDRLEVIEKTKEAMAREIPLLTPDIILVYGDVNGSVGAAQAAAEAGVPVAHIEAGLRSFDESMPEEHNRIAIDSLANFLFVTEDAGRKHLEKEKREGAIHFVGNTMIDTLVRMMPTIESTPLPLNLPNNFGVVTLHRPSNVDDPKTLHRMLNFLSDLSHVVPLLLPVHHRLRAAIDIHGLPESFSEKVLLVEPLGYIEFLRTLSSASFILTDSGGIQEEATFLNKRCFTLRKNTERPATVESGSNILIDIEKSEDRDAVFAFATHPITPAISIPPLWDGYAGERIVQVLKKVLSQ